MPTLDTVAATRKADTALKEALKDALVEVFYEEREMLQEVIEDALQEMALAEALREVEVHERRLGRRPGFQQIKGEA